MKKKNNKKGFTLAELLIVVAIIAVLVAIAIPIFTTQLEKSREATDLANVRSAYAELVTNYLTDGKAATATVPAKQKQENWQSDNNATSTTIGTDISVSGGGTTTVDVPYKLSGSNYELNITDSGAVSITP